MFNYRKISIGLIVAGFLLSFLSCTKQEKIWTVLANGLPKKVFVDGASRRVVYYILKQTHEPLFRKDDGENFTTRVLKSWNRNIEYTEYSFCPNTTLRFSSKKRFDEKFFLNYISETTRNFNKEFKCCNFLEMS